MNRQLTDHLRLQRMVRLAALCVWLISDIAFCQVRFANTQPAGPIGETNATLTGMAVPSSTGTVWFEWGPDSPYPAYPFLTAPIDISSGQGIVRLSTTIDSLVKGAAYHYRLVLSDHYGITRGADQRFTTGMKFATWSDYTYDSYPHPPIGVTNLVKVASGHAHSLGLRSDGTVIAWRSGIGFSDYGQTNVPPDTTNIVAIAGGWYHSLAVKQDGTVAAWGKYANTTKPVTPPATLSNVIAVAGGDSHSVALKSDGTVTAWGDNFYRQTSVPLNLTNVVAITAGSTHSLALKADGTVVGWGTLQGGSTANPAAPSWLTNVVAIASEAWHNLALVSDGTVVAWGANGYGQTNVPIGLSNVAAIAAGFDHSLALKADGTLVSWGAPSYVTNVPSGITNVVAISSGDYNSLALTPFNLKPLAPNQSFTGGTNADLLISLKSWDANGDPLQFRLASAPTNGTLYQFTGTGRGSVLDSADTPVSDPLARVLFSPDTDAVGAPYSTFGVIANDGEYDSAIGNITVNIITPPLIDSATFRQSPNPGFVFGFSAPSNLLYTVQSSTNLLNWSYLGMPSQSSPGRFLFLNKSATNWPQRFYRVSTL